MVNRNYELTINILAALILTRGVWQLLGRYSYSNIIFIGIGLGLLFYKNKIIDALPNYGMFTDVIQSRVLQTVGGLLIGYSAWNYLQPYVITSTWYVIGAGLFLLIFQKPIAELIKGGEKWQKQS